MIPIKIALTCVFLVLVFLFIRAFTIGTRYEVILEKIENTVFLGLAAIGFGATLWYIWSCI